MALILDDSRLYQKNVMGDQLHSPASNIDLLLECEDDQSYAIPRRTTGTGGLQLHTTSNVSMRISFSSCGGAGLSCQYCQCNFLSETHLMDHMDKFHKDIESEEEDGEDDGDDFIGPQDDQVSAVENGLHALTNGHGGTFSTNGHAGTFSTNGHAGIFSTNDHGGTLSTNDHGGTLAAKGHGGTLSTNDHEETLSTNGHGGTLSTNGHGGTLSTNGHAGILSANGHAGILSTNGHAGTLSTNGHGKSFSTNGHGKTFSTNGHGKTFSTNGHGKTFSANGHGGTFSAHGHVEVPRQKGNAADHAKPMLRNGKAVMKTPNPDNSSAAAPISCYTSGAYNSPPQVSPVSISPPTLPENGAAEQRNLKRKSSAGESPSNPRLTLTIKKSKSSYEVQREDSLIPVSPGMQMREENFDVQSDSTNETIDVESSSPQSSPGSVKNSVKTVVSGKKNTMVKFFCDQCEKGYVSKYALKRHIATHSDERPFICTFPGCKGAFKLKSRLTDHIRYVHKRKTPRTVSRSKSVPDTSTSSLSHHVLSPAPQAGGKPSAKTKTFKCTEPNCNREFRDAFNLASHMCLHTGLMPYKCSLCSFTSIQKTSFDWHMQTKHAQS